MNSILDMVSQLVPAQAPKNPSPFKCWQCRDMGTSIIRVGGVTSAKTCRCLKVKTAHKRLEVVPPIFEVPRLARLKARPQNHLAQAEVIQQIQSYPDDSYLFMGRNGSGKTHFSWALFRHAVLQKRDTMACTLRDLLEEFRGQALSIDTGERITPRVTPQLLKNFKHPPFFLFIDEIDKPRPSEFRCEMFFALLDAAKSFNHQLVLTSNLTINQLRDHWGRDSRMWGNSIIERLRGCYTMEMF